MLQLQEVALYKRANESIRPPHRVFGISRRTRLSQANDRNSQTTSHASV